MSWERRQWIMVTIWVVVSAVAYYDVLVYIPNYCRENTGCIPVEGLVTMPLMVIGPAMILIQITRIVMRRQKDRRDQRQ